MNKERFYKFIEQTPDCWLWQGSKDKNGYGYFKDKKTYKAHRYSYLLHKGDVGLYHVLHKCDNPSCVNPDHLFLGTNKDNMIDKVNKQRQSHHSRPMRGHQNPNKTITLKEALYIKEQRGKQTGVALAKQFNITPTQVSRIQRQLSWI